MAWLARYVDSPATLASYRKEAERLMLWCALQRGVALSDLTHEDLLVYQRFLTDPLPAERWVTRTKAGPEFAGMAAIRGSARTVKSTPGAVDPERHAVLAGGGGLS